MRRTRDGSLVYLDFGMMGVLEGNVRLGLMRAVLHLANREWGLLAQDMVTLGLLPAGGDPVAITQALTDVFQRAVGTDKVRWYGMV